MAEATGIGDNTPLLKAARNEEESRKQINGITNGAGSSKSNSLNDESLQTENSRLESESKLDQFFDSYISNEPLHENDDGVADSESVCSDSVSRCGGDGRNSRKNQSQHVNVEILQPSNPMPDAWYQQLQSDSSSLATLVTEKKISDSRRTFCLFVTFDLILTTLLWLIMCGTSATDEHNFIAIVGLQVGNYTLYTSMFDVVCLAAGRFAFLEVTYALLLIRHWWPVAVSTAITDVLLILKIFPIFQDSSDATYLSKAVPMTIVILLTNFVLSWIEVWFIDFKVLPAEAKLAQRTVRNFIQQSQNQQSLSFGRSKASETTPLIGNGRHARFAQPPSSYYTGASDKMSYHSVLDSEFDSPSGGGRRGNVFPAKVTQEEYTHVEKGRTALNQLWSLYNNDGIWKLDKELPNGDRVYSTDVPGFGKTFRIDTTVHVPAERIFHEIILKAEEMPSWNMSVDYVKILRRIGEQTAISLDVSKPAARGLIQSRDFITVRRVDKIDKSYISAGISTDYEIPESGRIRGENGPTGFIVTPCEDDFNYCKFTWILNTDLKGSLPQYLVHSNLASTLITFVTAMKRHLGAED